MNRVAGGRSRSSGAYINIDALTDSAKRWDKSDGEGLCPQVDGLWVIVDRFQLSIQGKVQTWSISGICTEKSMPRRRDVRWQYSFHLWCDTSFFVLVPFALPSLRSLALIAMSSNGMISAMMVMRHTVVTSIVWGRLRNHEDVYRELPAS